MVSPRSIEALLKASTYHQPTRINKTITISLTKSLVRVIRSSVFRWMSTLDRGDIRRLLSTIRTKQSQVISRLSRPNHNINPMLISMLNQVLCLATRIIKIVLSKAKARFNALRAFPANTITTLILDIPRLLRHLLQFSIKTPKSRCFCQHRLRQRRLVIFAVAANGTRWLRAAQVSREVASITWPITGRARSKSNKPLSSSILIHNTRCTLTTTSISLTTKALTANT